MGFLLRVLEKDGTVVEEVVADLNFNPVRMGFVSTEFPIMGALDPYRDISLDYGQCELLEREVQRAATRLAEKGVASSFIEELVRLCKVGRAKPKRRFVFIGD